MHKDGQVQTLPDGLEAIMIRDVRCACAVCGAHLMAWAGHTVSGCCGNCGSYDVRPLSAPPPRAALSWAG